MQILHRLAGSIQRYSEELSDPGRYRPDHCPQCEADRPLRAHGFYTRTLVDFTFDGTIRSSSRQCASKSVIFVTVLSAPASQFYEEGNCPLNFPQPRFETA